MKKYQPTTKEELKNLCDDLRISLKNIDVSLITDMSYLFSQTQRVDFSGIEDWNVSNVEYMNGMFYKAYNFNSDLSRWNVGNVVDMTSMFDGARSFNSDLSNWDVSNVEQMSFMFAGAKKINFNRLKWDISKANHFSIYTDFSSSEMENFKLPFIFYKMLKHIILILLKKRPT